MKTHHVRFAALLVPILGGLLTVACGAAPTTSVAAPPAPASVTSTAANPILTHPAAAQTSARSSAGVPGVPSASNAQTITTTSSSRPAQSTAIPAQAQPSGPIATGPTTRARPGHATHACQLVTAQEAQTALGTNPGTGMATDLSGGATACTYLAGKSTLQLSLTPSGGKATLDQQLAGLPKNNPAVAVVTGIGDHAFTQAQGTRAAVNFDEGDAMVVIGLDIAGATKPPLQQLDQLAKTAAARL